MRCRFSLLARVSNMHLACTTSKMVRGIISSPPCRTLSRSVGWQRKKLAMSKNNSPSLFESGHLRAQLATILLAVGIVADLIAIVSTFSLIGLLSRTLAGLEITEVEITAIASLLRCIGNVQFVVYLTTVVLFLRWIHRAHRNLPALGARNLRFSSGWAVGYWFIPIISLFRPYQVIKEISKASDPSIDSADASSWQNAAPSPVIGWWWAFWLISNFVGQASFRFSAQAKTLTDFFAMSWLSILSMVRVSLPPYSLYLSLEE